MVDRIGLTLCVLIFSFSFGDALYAQTRDELRQALEQFQTAWFAADQDKMVLQVTTIERWAERPDKDSALLVHYSAGFVRRQMAVYSRKRRDELERAITHLENALGIDNKHAESHALLASVYRMLIASEKHELDWFGKAKEHRARAWELAPENPRVLLLEAYALISIPENRGGDIDEGISAAFEAIGRFTLQQEDAPIPWGHVQTWAIIGTGFKKQKRYREAILAYEKGLAIQPNWPYVKESILPELKSLLAQQKRKRSQ